MLCRLYYIWIYFGGWICVDNRTHVYEICLSPVTAKCRTLIVGGVESTVPTAQWIQHLYGHHELPPVLWAETSLPGTDVNLDLCHNWRLGVLMRRLCLQATVVWVMWLSSKQTDDACGLHSWGHVIVLRTYWWCAHAQIVILGRVMWLSSEQTGNVHMHRLCLQVTLVRAMWLSSEQTSTD